MEFKKKLAALIAPLVLMTQQGCNTNFQSETLTKGTITTSIETISENEIKILNFGDGSYVYTYYDKNGFLKLQEYYSSKNKVETITIYENEYPKMVIATDNKYNIQNISKPNFSANGNLTNICIEETRNINNNQETTKYTHDKDGKLILTEKTTKETNNQQENKTLSVHYNSKMYNIDLKQFNEPKIKGIYNEENEFIGVHVKNSDNLFSIYYDVNGKPIAKTFCDKNSNIKSLIIYDQDGNKNYIKLEKEKQENGLYINLIAEKNNSDIYTYKILITEYELNVRKIQTKTYTQLGNIICHTKYDENNKPMQEEGYALEKKHTHQNMMKMVI